MSIQPGLQKQPGPENQFPGGWGRTEDHLLTPTPPQCYRPHPGRSLSVPHSHPHGPCPSPLPRGNSARKPGAVRKSGWAKDPSPPEEGRDCPLGGGPLPTVGERMQGFLEETSLGKKGVMQGRRWRGRRDSTRPRPLVWAPAEGVGSSGLTPPHLPSLGSWHGWPRELGLASPPLDAAFSPTGTQFVHL